ncbi:MAG TPA: alpha/beta fold hydrolase [Gemmatimonadaceae bacterium]
MITLVGDAEIAYDDIGTGLPVVFLHAFPLNRTMWAPQVSALAADYRCIAVDVRGLGESSASPPYTIDRYADDVIAVLDALQIQRAVFVGLSMGGYVAFSLWRRHAGRVRALVLANTRAAGDTPEAVERRRKLIELARAEGSTGVANVQIASLVGKTTRDKRPDIYDAVHRTMAQAPVAGVIGAIEALMGRADSTDLLGMISVPTLVIGGEEDAITRVKETRDMAGSIPGSRVEVIAEVGHLSNMERAGAFNIVLTEFLGSLLYS